MAPMPTFTEPPAIVPLKRSTRGANCPPGTSEGRAAASVSTMPAPWLTALVTRALTRVRSGSWAVITSPSRIPLAAASRTVVEPDVATAAMRSPLPSANSPAAAFLTLIEADATSCTVAVAVVPPAPSSTTVSPTCTPVLDSTVMAVSVVCGTLTALLTVPT